MQARTDRRRVPSFSPISGPGSSRTVVRRGLALRRSRPSRACSTTSSRRSLCAGAARSRTSLGIVAVFVNIAGGWDAWGLFEKFTERARQVVVLAQEEARTLQHTYIGTEHILLGLDRENEGVATHILLHFDANADTIRSTTLETLAGSGGRWSARSPGGGLGSRGAAHYRRARGRCLSTPSRLGRAGGRVASSNCH